MTTPLKGKTTSTLPLPEHLHIRIPMRNASYLYLYHGYKTLVTQYHRATISLVRTGDTVEQHHCTLQGSFNVARTAQNSLKFLGSRTSVRNRGKRGNRYLSFINNNAAVDPIVTKQIEGEYAKGTFYIPGNVPTLQKGTSRESATNIMILRWVDDEYLVYAKKRTYTYEDEKECVKTTPVRIARIDVTTSTVTLEPSPYLTKKSLVRNYNNLLQYVQGCSLSAKLVKGECVVRYLNTSNGNTIRGIYPADANIVLEFEKGPLPDDYDVPMFYEYGGVYNPRTE